MLAAFLDDLTSNLYAIRKSQTIKIGLGVNQMSQESNDSAELLITLTADIVAAHVSNNSVAVSDVSTLIGNVHAALAGLSGPTAAPETVLEPAVPIRTSVKRDYIVCLDDGKKLKMLKRHLMTHYGMTPDDYRAKWGLPADYPMVAPAYAEQRRELAKAIGLGRAPGSGRKKKIK
jgi:predicted transcriptional regulator